MVEDDTIVMVEDDTIVMVVVFIQPLMHDRESGIWVAKVAEQVL